MSVLTAPVPPPSPSPRRKRWTTDEFYDLWNRGYFDGRKAMLLDGEILEMGIPNPPHDFSLTQMDYSLKGVFTAGYIVRIQMPLPLNLWSDPIPDIAVVLGKPRDYLTSHPRKALLVSEISESSLATDLGDKALLYAAGGVPEYWVVDLVNRRLIVFRDPIVDPTVSSGYKYKKKLVLDSTATISPLAMPTTTFNVADWLP